MRTSFLVGGLIMGMAMVVGFGLAWEPAPVRSQTPITVSLADVKAAGFTHVTVQPQQGGVYAAPNVYFRAKESVAAAHPEWTNAVDLIAVLVRPMPDMSWRYHHGTQEILDLAGRTQVNASRPGYFISVTGPDKAKTLALTQILLQKK